MNGRNETYSSNTDMPSNTSKAAVTSMTSSTSPAMRQMEESRPWLKE